MNRPGLANGCATRDMLRQSGSSKEYEQIAQGKGKTAENHERNSALFRIEKRIDCTGLNGVRRMTGRGNQPGIHRPEWAQAGCQGDKREIIANPISGTTDGGRASAPHSFIYTKSINNHLPKPTKYPFNKILIFVKSYRTGTSWQQAQLRNCH